MKINDMGYRVSGREADSIELSIEEKRKLGGTVREIEPEGHM